ncbi:hypothetical protein D4R20_01145 [bacterium]|nr:MAG: hypothetical protein D4R20_01145 [bacterium]
MNKLVFLIITGVAIVIVSCNSGCSSGNSDRPKTTEELKMEIKIKEQSTPTKYLTVTGRKMYYNSDADRWVVEGMINNSATVAKFKDIVLLIQLFSQTGTVIGQEEYIIYKFSEPNSSIPFSIKFFNHPDDTKNYFVLVKNATAVN